MLPEEDKDTRPADTRPYRKLTFSDGLDLTTIILVIGMTVAISFVFLADFILDGTINWKNVGVDTGIIAGCTISIYLLLRSFARRRGRRTKEWVDARARLNKKGRELVEKGDIEHASTYCREWEDERLRSDRKEILSCAGLNIEDYEKTFCKYGRREIRKTFPNLTAVQRRTIAKARRVRRLRYNEGYLSANAKKRGRHSPSGGLTSDTIDILQAIKTIITTLVAAFCSAAIVQEIIFNPSKEAVVALIVKLVIIAFSSAFAMVGGYNLSAVREVDEMNDRADEMDKFKKWCDEHRTMQKAGE